MSLAVFEMLTVLVPLLPIFLCFTRRGSYVRLSMSCKRSEILKSIYVDLLGKR